MTTAMFIITSNNKTPQSLNRWHSCFPLHWSWPNGGSEFVMLESQGFFYSSKTVILWNNIIIILSINNIMKGVVVKLRMKRERETEVRPLSKAPNPQLLPWRRSINGCPLLQVCSQCVCSLGWVKCRVQILSMGHHTCHTSRPSFLS